MALQSSGSISFSQIRDEFGASKGTEVSFGRYRADSIHFTNKVIGRNVSNRLGSVGNYLPLDIGVPTTGQIKASDFYSKKLNMVVDFYSGDTETRVSASSQYTDDNEGSTVKCVGGFRFAPSSPSGSRVIVYVAKKIGSETGGVDRCALRTGGTFWNGSSLEIEIGPAGGIYGAGGDGGDGGDANNGDGLDGEDGSSALGIQYGGITKINNLGRIQAGYGGGGGGGGKSERRKSGKKRSKRHSSGGGGGGAGAGFPNAVGGDGNSSNIQNEGTAGSDGGDGTDTTSGALGAGGREAGDGGAGQIVDNSSTKGSDGVATGGSGGIGGSGGFAIYTNQGSLPTITGNAVIGRTATSVNPQ